MSCYTACSPAPVHCSPAPAYNGCSGGNNGNIEINLNGGQTGSSCGPAPVFYSSSACKVQSAPMYNTVAASRSGTIDLDINLNGQGSGNRGYSSGAVMPGYYGSPTPRPVVYTSPVHSGCGGGSSNNGTIELDINLNGQGSGNRGYSSGAVMPLGRYGSLAPRPVIASRPMVYGSPTPRPVVYTSPSQSGCRGGSSNNGTIELDINLNGQGSGNRGYSSGAVMPGYYGSPTSRPVVYSSSAQSGCGGKNSNNGTIELDINLNGQGSGNNGYSSGAVMPGYYGSPTSRPVVYTSPVHSGCGAGSSNNGTVELDINLNGQGSGNRGYSSGAIMPGYYGSPTSRPVVYSSPAQTGCGGKNSNNGTIELDINLNGQGSGNSGYPTGTVMPLGRYGSLAPRPVIASRPMVYGSPTPRPVVYTSPAQTGCGGKNSNNGTLDLDINLNGQGSGNRGYSSGAVMPGYYGSPTPRPVVYTSPARSGCGGKNSNNGTIELDINLNGQGSGNSGYPTGAAMPVYYGSPTSRPVVYTSPARSGCGGKNSNNGTIELDINLNGQGSGNRGYSSGAVMPGYYGSPTPRPVIASRPMVYGSPTPRPVVYTSPVHSGCGGGSSNNGTIELDINLNGQGSGNRGYSSGAVMPGYYGSPTPRPVVYTSPARSGCGGKNSNNGTIELDINLNGQGSGNRGYSSGAVMSGYYGSPTSRPVVYTSPVHSGCGAGSSNNGTIELDINLNGQGSGNSGYSSGAVMPLGRYGSLAPRPVIASRPMVYGSPTPRPVVYTSPAQTGCGGGSSNNGTIELDINLNGQGSGNSGYPTGAVLPLGRYGSLNPAHNGCGGGSPNGGAIELDINMGAMTLNGGGCSGGAVQYGSAPLCGAPVVACSPAPRCC